MSKTVEMELTCPQCRHQWKGKAYRTIWVEYPENMDLILKDQINVVQCPACKFTSRLPFAFMATNVKKGIAIWYEPYPDPHIDSDLELYRKHYGPDCFWATAPRIRTWAEFKQRLVQLNRQPHAPATMDDLVSLRKGLKSVATELRQKSKGFPDKRDGVNEKTGEKRIQNGLFPLSNFTKLFLAVTSVWILWVWIRTDTEFQLVGYYFEQWRTNMVLPNLLVGPVLLLVGGYVYRLYVRKHKSTERSDVVAKPQESLEARYAEQVTDCIREMGDRGDVALHAQLYPDFMSASFEVCKAGFEGNVPAKHVAGFIAEAAASYQSDPNVGLKLLEYARARIPQLWPVPARSSTPL